MISLKTYGVAVALLSAAAIAPVRAQETPAELSAPAPASSAPAELSAPAEPAPPADLSPPAEPAQAPSPSPAPAPAEAPEAAAEPPAQPAGRRPAEFAIDVAGWTGGAFGREDTRQFSHCGIQRSYDNGLTLVFSVNAERQLNIGLMNPQWTLEEGARQVAQVKIDDSYTKQFAAVPGSPTAMVLPTDRDQDLLVQLRRGNLMSVTLGDQKYDFPLTGSAAGLGALDACVERARALAGQPGTGPSGEDGADGAMSVRELAGLLTQAGLQDVKFVPPDQLPANLQHGWVVGNLKGGLIQEPRQQAAVEIDAFAEQFIEQLRDSCEATLEENVQPAEIIGEKYAVKQASFRCTAGEQPSAVAMTFALDDGNYSAFFHEAALADEQAAKDATNKIDALIRRVTADAVARAAAPPQ